MNSDAKKSIIVRLRRIEGQAGGLLRMVGDERYCAAVLIQIKAVRAALHKVERQILDDYVTRCVARAFTKTGGGAQRYKVEELVESIRRMTR